MQQMVQPIMEQWQDPRLANSLSSAYAFGEFLQLDGLQKYILSHQAQDIEDWSSCPLDDEGKALQIRIKSACDASH